MQRCLFCFCTVFNTVNYIYLFLLGAEPEQINLSNKIQLKSKKHAANENTIANNSIKKKKKNQD